jgi:hypothetical protein
MPEVPPVTSAQLPYRVFMVWPFEWESEVGCAEVD